MRIEENGVIRDLFRLRGKVSRHGTAMTSRRLRSAGHAQWVVILFFIPIANLVTLAVLCVLPERIPDATTRRRCRRQLHSSRLAEG
jgi:hypothetical protein